MEKVALSLRESSGSLTDDQVMRNIDQSAWTKTLSARKKWFDINLVELWDYRYLIVLIVRREMVAGYKQSLLGPFWFVLPPLLTTGVFTLVFGEMVKINTNDVSPFLFYLAGNVCWIFLAGCVAQVANTFMGDASLSRVVYFPRLIPPISMIIFAGIKFVIQLGLFVLFLLYYRLSGYTVSSSYAVVPLTVLLVIQMAFLGFSCGMILASLTVKYRDFSYVVGLGTQIWMFASPVIYSLEQVPEHLRTLYALNPMVAVLVNFRAIFLGTTPADMMYAIMSLVLTLLLFLWAMVAFSRSQRTFVDTV